VVGFVSYIRGRRNPDGLYVGVVAMLAFTLWLPVMPAGLLLLSGAFGGVDSSEWASSAVDFVGLCRRCRETEPGSLDDLPRRHRGLVSSFGLRPRSVT
jgi:hypothetical protein